MRRALPASLALHLGALGGAYLLFVGAQSVDDPLGVESMTVDLIPIVATTNVTPDAAEVEATTAQVSAGSDEAVVAEAEPVETLEPQQTDLPETPPPETIEEETAEATEDTRAERVEAAPRPDVEPPEKPVEAVEPEKVEPATQRMEVAALSEPLLSPVEPVATPPVEMVELEPEHLEPPPELLTAEPSGEVPVEGPLPVPEAVLEPIEETDVPPSPAEVETPPEEPVETARAEPVEVAMADPLTPALELPELMEEIELPPVPRPKTVTQTNVPTYPEPEPEKPAPREASKKKPAEKPEPSRKTAEPRKEPRKQVANLGNGGQNQADTAAGKASGGKGKASEAGSAEVTKYPGLVRQRVNRNVKSGGRGTVFVSFVVAQSGSVSNISILRSSGNAKLDNAVIAAVKRAAPFPPIPAGADKVPWPFKIEIESR